jgi:hypothetical protein
MPVRLAQVATFWQQLALTVKFVRLHLPHLPCAILTDLRHRHLDNVWTM